MKNWWNKPITRGDICKNHLWSLGLTVIFMAGVGLALKCNTNSMPRDKEVEETPQNEELTN